MSESEAVTMFQFLGSDDQPPMIIKECAGSKKMNAKVF